MFALIYKPKPKVIKFPKTYQPLIIERPITFSSCFWSAVKNPNWIKMINEIILIFNVVELRLSSRSTRLMNSKQHNKNTKFNGESLNQLEITTFHVDMNKVPVILSLKEFRNSSFVWRARRFQLFTTCQQLSDLKKTKVSLNSEAVKEM